MTIPKSKLATPWQRLGAKILDGLIAGWPAVFLLPVMFSVARKAAELSAQGLSKEQMDAQIHEMMFNADTMKFIIFSWAIWIIVLIIQMIFLTRDGQTLGKKALKIRIVKSDTGKNGGLCSKRSFARSGERPDLHDPFYWQHLFPDRHALHFPR